MESQRKTKIVATIGPSCNNESALEQLIVQGVDVFRLNFSHGSREEHFEVVKIIQNLNSKLGTNVGILADLQGPKIRLGNIAKKGIALNKGDKVRILTSGDKDDSRGLPTTYQAFAKDVEAGQVVLIDDGKIELKVLDTNKSDEVNLEVVYGGLVLSKKGINLPETNISSPSLTDKDTTDLEYILKHDLKINWIALSFLRHPNEIIKLRGMIEFYNHPAKIIAKIEKPEAVNNIDDIIDATDAVMVARGDLGVELPVAQMPTIQKEIVRKCIQSSKPVIIATQMMESMIDNPVPTRAEVSDVANAVFDGADAVMLSGETAVGKYPVKVIQTMGEILDRVESEPSIYDKDHLSEKDSEKFLSDAICYNACKIARDVGASAIIGMTQSGYTAFKLSSYRPKADVFVFTENIHLLNAVSLLWGVRAFFYDKFISTDVTIADVQNILKDKGFLRSGDIVINTGSMPIGERGTTNTIKVGVVG